MPVDPPGVVPVLVVLFEVERPDRVPGVDLATELRLDDGQAVRRARAYGERGAGPRA